jgi:hypothetical protein
MERVWVFDHLAVSVAWIDFLDPELAGQPDVRERGVRIEVRTTSSSAEGTIYVSPSRTLEPAVCRIDFLESRPGAADRMHWHPTMGSGEPGNRTFDERMPPDPAGWLRTFLGDLEGFLVQADVPDVGEMAGDLEAVRAAAGEIGSAVEDGLSWARTSPWPDVVRDARGLAISGGRTR